MFPREYSEAVLPFQLRPRDYGKGLQIGVGAGGFEAQALVPLLDQKFLTRTGGMQCRNF